MIRFDEKEHKYYNGDKELISVTRLMQKHGLAPNYSAVSSLVLEAAAKRGTLIHSEIQEYIENGVLGFSTELGSFIEYLEKNSHISIKDDEFMVYNDIVAGRADLLLKYKKAIPSTIYSQPLKKYEEFLIIADIKTTSTIHYDSVSWQLSIYAYLSKQDIKKGQVFWFKKDGTLEVKDIPLKAKEEVEKLFECERKGEIYQKPVIINDTDLLALEEVEQTIKYYENMKKEAEIKANEMREAIIKAMEKNGLKSFENDRIKLTYIAPSERVSIDTTRLKNENPAIYLEYQKKTKVKASLRITLKED